MLKQKEYKEENSILRGFQMVDVTRKRPTLRRAIACGSINMDKIAFDLLINKKLPKGDVLSLAEIAGIMGAKKTPDLIPMCHTIPLNQVSVFYELDINNNSVKVYAEVIAQAKTGVEMEALTAVQSSLLTLWDLTKGTYPALCINKVELLLKTGGKSGTWINPRGIPSWLEEKIYPLKKLENIKCSILVMSDRASKGVYQDESGELLKILLEQEGAKVETLKVIPDNKKIIQEEIKDICRNLRPRLLLTSGGTGPGPRDITPEALEEISTMMLDGLGDLLRAESLHVAETAWLSRMTASMVESTLVIALPGSPKAIKECWDILIPFLGNAIDKIQKQGYEVGDE